ncbi:FAD-dependent oxidoreductase [Chloroflexota bacterium]
MTKLNELGKVVETDILVIGAGVGGCGAALAARDKKAKVLLVDKGSFASCGQIGAGNANYHTFLHYADGDNAEEYSKFFGRDQESLSIPLYRRVIAERLLEMLKRIEAMGVELHKNPDGKYRVDAGFGQTFPWNTTLANGKYVKRLISKGVRETGADIAEYVMITAILKDKNDGRAAGAIGFNVHTGESVIFRSKAMVMCLASSNERFSNSCTNNPFNSWNYPFNTGSGPVMAYEAGAKVTAVESAKATMLPWGLGTAGMMVYTSLGAYMLNGKGERYMFKYHPKGERAPRQLSLLGTYAEISEGRGPCYIDARHIAPDDIDFMINDRLYVEGNTFPEYFAQKGLDLRKEIMEIETGEINGGGCVVVNNKLESGVKGLFSYSPANMSAAMCAGYAACLEALDYRKSSTGLPEVDVEQAAVQKDKTLAPMKSKGDYSWREYEDVLRQIMNYYMGYIRSPEGMETGLKKINHLAEHLKDIRANNPHELARANESAHLTKYCQLMIRSAMERKESKRFCYKRMDYPELDPAWDGKYVVQWQEKGKPEITLQTMDVK